MRSMSQPAKVATPLTAPCGFWVHDTRHHPAVVMVNVTELELPVAVACPPASCTVTMGWVEVGTTGRAARLLVNATFAAAPG